MGSLGIVPNLGQIYNPDSFTGNGSNTTFTLTHLVTSDQSVIWVEGGVVQKPGIDFTISGLTLTRTTAPVNLVACFAMYLGVSLDIGTPSDGTVTLSKMAVNSIDSDQYSVDSDAYVDGSIDNAHIADNAIDSEHYTDGSIDNAHIADDAIDSEHYVDASIDNAHLADDAVGVDELSATGTASSSTFLRGDNAWVAVSGISAGLKEGTRALDAASGTQDFTGFGFDPAIWAIIMQVAISGDGSISMSHASSAGPLMQSWSMLESSRRTYINSHNDTYLGDSPGNSQDTTSTGITDGVRLTWNKTGTLTSGKTIQISIMAWG